MTMADDPGDLSVRLDWPVDPLSEPASEPEPEPPTKALDSRLDALEARLQGARGDDLGQRIDTLGREVVEALRAINDSVRQLVDENLAAFDERLAGLRTAMMAMLASRQAEEQRAQRRDRDSLLTHLDEQIAGMSRSLTEAVAAARTQSDVFADRVAAELQALRRRITVRGKDSPENLDELVTRVADEVEIRFAAALNPKTRKKG